MPPSPKSVAIMQPYFFPYLGYFQLMRAVDCFIIYDDVCYIKNGWINRNRILINEKSTYITAPLQKSSPNKRICDIGLVQSSIWRDKLVKMIEINYRKSPYFSEVYPIIKKIIYKDVLNLSNFLSEHLMLLAEFMGIDSEFVLTSRCYGNQHLSAKERVLDICKKEGASLYINSQGGQALYDTDLFRSHDIDLRFIVTRPIPYKQKKGGFVPYLSIIDVLMAVGPVEIKRHIDAFDLTLGRQNEQLVKFGHQEI